MPFPEWGYSYNALRVPLTSDWQCSLVPARDVQDAHCGWELSREERKKRRKKRKKRIEQDRRDFDRLFRVSISRRDARARRDFSAYVRFIRQHLHISGLATPVDGESVTRILREAVRDGWLIPAIDRAWCGSRRVTRFYAPQSWPKRAPDPKPIAYGVRNGQFIPLDEDGRFIDHTSYVPVAAGTGATVSRAGSSNDGAGWLGALEEAAAVLGGDDSGGDDRESSTSEVDMFGDAATPLGNAQPFEYQPDIPDRDVDELAGMPFNGEPGTWISSMPGTMPQLRQYGLNGTPLTDFDLEAHHGNPNPHAHNWDGYSRDEGAPVSLLPW
jgi:hypothetical protein